MMLINTIISMITPQMMKDFADMLCDFIEDKAVDSESKFDDATVLPLCKMVRIAFDIPDQDDRPSGIIVPGK